ncbi:papain-like cysteine protease family protein [Sphingobium yanoikuyae]|uniref:papain-like cysteine protease family protein n=1 Tax=Sphingobium yanoikuyae TaxID=13690 RepID=UPI0028AAAE9C|nr:papain-like cysteine protease family protein [Sphingobium yanoikuyae]
MGKSIMELERALHRPGTSPARTPGAPSMPVKPARPGSCLPASHAVTAKRKAMSTARAYGLGQRAKAFNAIDVRVSGTVGALRQRNAMTCWATVYTMLVNWKNQRSEPVEHAIAGVGARWSALLAQGDTRGLNAAEKVDFLADAGLVALPPQNPTLQRWADMLGAYGPLWVTTDEAPPNLMIHARLLIAMQGDGSADGTRLTLINPGDGGTDVETFAAFLTKFEAEAANPQGVLRVQIVHWPAGAQAFSFAKAAMLPPAAPPSLLGGTARRALVAALTSRGMPPTDADQLVDAFAAEIMANGNRPVPLSYRAGAFDAATVPHPDDGDPTETAREILGFFYPGRSFASIGNDHVRLAARIFYAALEKQKAINLLPDIPTSPPGPSWLARQAVKIVWRQVSGPSGIMVAVRNAVALQWRTTLEEIENGLPPTALGHQHPSRLRALSYVEQQGLTDWINNPDIPLSPAVGGRSLDHAALEIGDLIVSTTTQAPSIAIRRIGSPVSHIMLYVGGGMVVEAVGEGVVHRPLADALAHSYVGVAFRHPAITPDQALQVRDYVGLQIGKPYDYELIVAHARFQLGRMVCDQLPAAMQDRCRSIVGPVDIGRGNDSRFICSSLVAEAFASVGLPLLPIPPRGATPGDIAMNANLIYLGHVKYDPPAGLADRIGRM